MEEIRSVLGRIRGIEAEEIVDPDKYVTRFKCLRICGAACCTFAETVFHPYDLFKMYESGAAHVLIAILYEVLIDKKLIPVLGKETSLPLVVKPSGIPCPFLLYEKGAGKCLIYDVRPQECRAFPFGRLVMFKEGKSVLKAVIHRDLCPKEAFETGEPRTISEYWEENGLAPMDEEILTFFRRLSEVSKKFLEESKLDQETARIYLVVRLIQSILALEEPSFNELVSLYELSLKSGEPSKVIEEAKEFVERIWNALTSSI